MNKNTPVFVLQCLDQRIMFSGAAYFNHTTAELSVARRNFGTFQIGANAYLVGGNQQIGSRPSYSMDVLNLSETPINVRPVPLRAIAIGGPPAVSIGNRSYFDFSSLGSVEVYNANTQRFTSMKAQINFYVMDAIVLGDRILLTGRETVQPFKSVAFFLDPKTGKTRNADAPESAGAESTRIGDLNIFASGIIFNLRTRKWGSLPPPVAGYNVASVGTKAIFFSNDYTVVYDLVTGLSSVMPFPTNDRFAVAATSVGTKAIFAGGLTNGSQSDTVDIYDTATGQWSTSTLSLARGGMAAFNYGNKAVFAGGGYNFTVTGGTSVPNIDIFTDLSPVPVLSGGITGSPGKSITTQIFNTGDAPLAAGANVKIYATAVRGVIDLTSALLGNQIMPGALAAADNKPLHIRTAIPTNLTAGKYFLVAAVDDNSTGQTVTTPVASSDIAYKLNGQSKPNIARAMIGALTGLFRR